MVEIEPPKQKLRSAEDRSTGPYHRSTALAKYAQNQNACSRVRNLWRIQSTGHRVRSTALCRNAQMQLYKPTVLSSRLTIPRSRSTSTWVVFPNLLLIDYTLQLTILITSKPLINVVNMFQNSQLLHTKSFQFYKLLRVKRPLKSEDLPRTRCFNLRNVSFALQTLNGILDNLLHGNELQPKSINFLDAFLSLSNPRWVSFGSLPEKH